MKKWIIPFVLIIVATGVSCKKDNPKDGPVLEKKVVVTTVAGSDNKNGFLDGPALSAKFGYPEDVAVTDNGILYVTDLFNGRIRKIADGQVSTFAGNDNTAGIENGNGLSALFIYPSRIAISNGNLYTLDGLDPRVRKITPAADVSTFAGVETFGFKDGKADIAEFQESSAGIASDKEGNIYVADTRNNSIRKITVSGEVTTIAGTGIAGFKEGEGKAAQFNHPGGISLDQQGNLFVADRENHRIRKMTAAGQVTTFAGNGYPGFADGEAGVAQFNNIDDMVIDSHGNLYVTDDHRIRKISTQGVVSTIAGSTPGLVDGVGAQAKFYYPLGMGIDAADNIYVADSYNQRIRKISFE